MIYISIIFLVCDREKFTPITTVILTSICLIQPTIEHIDFLLSKIVLFINDFNFHLNSSFPLKDL